MKKFKIAALSLFWSVATFAANNSKMVWETPAEDISKSVSGPMAKVIALVVVGGASVLLGLFNITGGVVIG